MSSTTAGPGWLFLTINKSVTYREKTHLFSFSMINRSVRFLDMEEIFHPKFIESCFETSIK